MEWLQVRKTITVIEEIKLEMAQPVPHPVMKGLGAAVITNPYAGRYEQELASLPDAGPPLARMLCDRLLDAMRASPETVQAYGKGAIVGTAGELEHAAAIIHPSFGKSVRNSLKCATTLMPSVAKRGGPGEPIDIPLHHVINEWSFDHFDAMTLAIPDAPGPDEMVILLALATGGRPLARTRPAEQVQSSLL